MQNNPGQSVTGMAITAIVFASLSVLSAVAGLLLQLASGAVQVALLADMGVQQPEQLAGPVGVVVYVVGNIVALIVAGVVIFSSVKAMNHGSKTAGILGGVGLIVLGLVPCCQWGVLGVCCAPISLAELIIGIIFIVQATQLQEEPAY